MTHVCWKMAGSFRGRFYKVHIYVYTLIYIIYYPNSKKNMSKMTIK